jgi:predicted nucleotidyltransferase
VIPDGGDALRHLSAQERDCLRRYCDLLRERLGDRLERLVLFGSAARGDMWSAGSPMHSDIDLLVVTRDSVAEREAEELVNETYALYLECGRQIGPQFRTAGQLAEPENERAAVFAANVARDGVEL